MALIKTRPTNGIALGFEYLATAQDESDGYITFNFQINRKMVATFQAGYLNGLNIPITDPLITYPAIGQVKLANNAAVKEITKVKFPAGTLLDGKYWTISSTAVDYYVWYDTGASIDPAPVGPTPIHVVVNSTDTAAQICAKTIAALNAVGGGAVFSAATPVLNTINNGVNDPGDQTVAIITHLVAGDVATDAADVDAGVLPVVLAQGAAISVSPFTITEGMVFRVVAQPDSSVYANLSN